MLIFCPNQIEDIFFSTCWWSWRWFWRCRESRSPHPRTWLYYLVDNDYDYLHPHPHPRTCWKGSWSPSAPLATSWMSDWYWWLLFFTFLILSLIKYHISNEKLDLWRYNFVEVSLQASFIHLWSRRSLIPCNESSEMTTSFHRLLTEALSPGARYMARHLNKRWWKDRLAE